MRCIGTGARRPVGRRCGAAFVAELAAVMPCAEGGEVGLAVVIARLDVVHVGRGFGAALAPLVGVQR